MLHQYKEFCRGPDKWEPISRKEAFLMLEAIPFQTRYTEALINSFLDIRWTETQLRHKTLRMKRSSFSFTANRGNRGTLSCDVRVRNMHTGEDSDSWSSSVGFSFTSDKSVAFEYSYCHSHPEITFVTIRMTIYDRLMPIAGLDRTWLKTLRSREVDNALMVLSRFVRKSESAIQGEHLVELLSI